MNIDNASGERRFVGPRGAQGATGAQGSQGAQGATGAQGVSGTTIADISCKASGSTTANNNVSTPCTMGSESYDTDTMHSTSSNTERITVKTAGKFLVTAYCRFASNSSGSTRQPSLGGTGGATGGASVLAKPSSAMQTWVTIQFIADMAVNDYFSMSALQDSGTNLSIDYGMTVQRMGT